MQPLHSTIQSSDPSRDSDMTTTVVKNPEFHNMHLSLLATTR